MVAKPLYLPAGVEKTGSAVNPVDAALQRTVG